MVALPLLSIQNLSLLHVGPINLTLCAHHCIGLSGPSGCGKSVLLKAIADLLESNGEMSLEGQSHKAITAPDWRKKVQLVPAESLWWHNTVGKHFEFPIKQAWLARLSLDSDIAQQAVNQLSTGQKQRLALLRSLEKKPKVLLLDEPTASLDNSNTDSVEKFIKEYITDNNAAALWISHDPSQLERVANTTLYMIDGELEGAAA
ncbi:ABC transporter ATP-binding protein [Alkalimarinus coralli]|uniref:ABC transporter ATP-binding protein n=1 Tax=Alkalimarinus coralli TaxID=2935863 RepID=UPI00202BA025|nr:ATP-binding cassette domain-containing protein [Alkalimarinus coralli]